jgi:hypothetical protein
MYDMKKQLAAMALTLRNVAVLDTKARSKIVWGTASAPA